MRISMRLVMCAALVALVTGCASTGGGWHDDWKGCAVTGAAAGAAAGAIEDSDAAVGGAVVGAAIGAIVCAVRGGDEDGDGVRDDDDQCPGTPPDTPVDAFGCEFDADGDGVVDRLDQCPDTPAGARVDERGCELDSDGDGVVDSKDRCPGTPAGEPVDEFGCEFDGDGDGVVDGRDQCPDTKPGTPVDNNGCDLLARYRMEGIRFEFDSAELTADSQAALADALQILQRHPDLVVEIAGHTDSMGAESYNQGLSERRANAVRDYLAANGANAANLSAKGYGESEPVADNATEEGRAANRRVELRHGE
ncbi:MAG: OmpA family protein [Xanthomonadales bacterium]|nr:OmpA family protein [Xanthomonadales bacterium]NIN60383.1 OmpA family protein [Xanthomonadales bacterium]NIN75736.1 OmpA family protein [Xanthomonadales bacterium]NIO14298.1 OmpA family protein [Xanthomonadales bacterium]NIP12776.1 OmpA family protein [Xanthomonadales bacterium]